MINIELLSTALLADIRPGVLLLLFGLALLLKTVVKRRRSEPDAERKPNTPPVPNDPPYTSVTPPPNPTPIDISP